MMFCRRKLRPHHSGIHELRDGSGRILRKISCRFLVLQQSTRYYFQSAAGRELCAKFIGLCWHVRPLQGKLFRSIECKKTSYLFI